MNCDFSQPSLPNYCLHVTVSGGGGDSRAVLIGVVTALFVVVLAESLTRHRGRRERLEEATHGFLAEMSIAQHVMRSPATDISDVGDEIFPKIASLGRIRSLARWPVRDHKKIRAEVDVITLRLAVAYLAWMAGKLEPGESGKIVGKGLASLVFRTPPTLKNDDLSAALAARGLPVEDENI
jgi:hypothetical protein